MTQALCPLKSDCPRRRRPLVVAVLAVLALSGGGCDDEDVPVTSAGRDTRLEWPVDSGGFSTDGGLPEAGSHGGDAHTHDSADAHGPGDGGGAETHAGGDGHTHETGDAHSKDAVDGPEAGGDHDAD
jgi:hypothetical protein